MNLVRAILVLVAFVLVAGRYALEKKRLAVISRLSGEAGRDYYEAARRGTDHLVVVVTALMVAGAVAALVYFRSVPHS